MLIQGNVRLKRRKLAIKLGLVGIGLKTGGFEEKQF
jgi:hypothetical protein